jgi:hypothetical protein
MLAHDTCGKLVTGVLTVWVVLPMPTLISFDEQKGRAVMKNGFLKSI